MKSTFLSVILLLSTFPGLTTAQTLRVTGSTTVNPVVAEAAEILRKEAGLIIQVDTTGGSSGGIHALGEGRADLAMSSRPLTDADRQKHPAIQFTPHRVGEDALALIVSHDVWQGGIKSISREQMQAIYERKTTNWKSLGGPDRRIAFFNKEPGRGTWEVFAIWLYGKAENSPPVAHPEVGANEEARTKVASTRGAISQLSASWVDGKSIHALAIIGSDGRAVEPTTEHIADGSYPLNRTLWLITNGSPEGAAKQLIDFIQSPRGHEIVKKHGYLPPTATIAANP
ncbi:MAG: phosphate ABC transporter substrate-binding protein [Luteolibacter sp.]